MRNIKKNEEIVIRNYGKKTIAYLKRDGKVVFQGESFCHPDDEFDIAVGASVAIERLFENNKTKKNDKYLNGKVVCVESPYCWWTVGKVYNVIDGIVTADDNSTYPIEGEEPYRDYADIRHAGCQGWITNRRHNLLNVFIEYKE